MLETSSYIKLENNPERKEGSEASSPRARSVLCPILFVSTESWVTDREDEPRSGSKA